MEHTVAQHIEVGKLGEDIACKYLKSKGYKIVERNFRRKWGEIDIICKKKQCISNTNNTQVIHSPFFERVLTSLKSVLRRTDKRHVMSFVRHMSFVEENPLYSGQEKMVFVEVKTLKGGDLNPEDNVTLSKQKKLIRTCELYLADKKFDPDTDWQIDVVAIRLDRGTDKADINHIENAVYYS